MTRAGSLRIVKSVHTMAWAFFAACVVLIPVMAWRREFTWALCFIALVLVEVAVLSLNAWHCPLTPIAARFTEDRRPNFDIFLPEWLARRNKEIFGSLFVAGLLLTIGRWFGWLG
jgi:hypothetical protein